ncbi:hypothetical protein Sulfitobl28_14140 [Sulfitobacter pontiacus]|nr:hypothetical protein Sulfitobl28_14140 [Sulfitobacter pontiacus]
MVGDFCIVGGGVQQGRGRLKLVIGHHAFAAGADQPVDKVLGEFGVGLDGPDLIIIQQGRVGAEVGRADHLGPIGQLGDLILMPGIQGQGLSVDGVFGAAHGPAAGEFLDLAAKGLCNDLVAKADADQRAACLADGADQLFQRGIQS